MVQVWETIKDPGPQPEEPGLEPDVFGGLEYMAWSKKCSVYEWWQSEHNRYVLAQSLKTLYEAAKQRKGFDDDTLINLMNSVITMSVLILTNKAYRPGLFG
jgi:hypothetical protein